MKLSEHPFFKPSSHPAIKSLLQSVVIENYRHKETIFEEGDPSDSFYIILEGKVLFTKKSFNGDKAQPIRTASRGEFFGEMGVLTDEPRILSAKAKSSVKLARISRAALISFIKTGGSLKEQLLENIVEHLPSTIHHYTEQLQEQHAEAKIGRALHTVIHDFKNPFATIKLGVQLLARDHDDAKTLRICRNIEEQVQHMVDMVDEIREFSGGRQDLHVTPFTLRDLIDRFKELNYPLFEKKSIGFEFDIDDIHVEADSTKLLRLLQNLIHNAQESLPAKGEKSGIVRVTSRADPDSQTFRITVEDNGNGIPESIQKNLFDPFITSGKSYGTGLGLAIVKAIVDAHQGRIQFHTHKNTGTRFDVTLPLQQKHPSCEKPLIPLRS